jgi:hypothetical protein
MSLAFLDEVFQQPAKKFGRVKNSAEYTSPYQNGAYFAWRRCLSHFPAIKQRSRPTFRNNAPGLQD